ncbi:MAG: hypothetical protein K6C36_03065 [Clostridia bacterium]|nr:hypothetical protein [Clostridia bacterium]
MTLRKLKTKLRELEQATEALGASIKELAGANLTDPSLADTEKLIKLVEKQKNNLCEFYRICGELGGNGKKDDRLIVEFADSASEGWAK